MSLACTGLTCPGAGCCAAVFCWAACRALHNRSLQGVDLRSWERVDRRQPLLQNLLTYRSRLGLTTKRASGAFRQV